MSIEFIDTPFGRQLQASTGAFKPDLGTMGPSHSLYAAPGIFWALWALYHADITYNWRPHYRDDFIANPNGELATYPGHAYGHGGSGTDFMIAHSLPDFQADPTDLLIIFGPSNDDFNAGQSAVKASFDNVITVAEAALGNGKTFAVLLTGFYGGSSTHATWYANLCRSYCATHPQVQFAEPEGLFLPNAASGALDFTGGVAVYGGASTDYAHLGFYGSIKYTAPFVERWLRSLGIRERRPRLLYNAGAFTPDAGRYGSLIGDTGNMQGTGGSVTGVGPSSNVVGVGGSSGNLALNWGFGNMVMTPTIGTRADGFKEQIMTLNTGAGYSILNGDITTTITNPDNDIAGALYDQELVLRLNNIVGLSNIRLKGPEARYDSPTMSVGSGALADIIPDNTTVELFVYSPFPFPVEVNSPTFSFLLESQKAMTGVIGASKWSVSRTAP